MGNISYLSIVQKDRVALSWLATANTFFSVIDGEHSLSFVIAGAPDVSRKLAGAPGTGESWPRGKIRIFKKREM